jgi:hypothetical protein
VENFFEFLPVILCFLYLPSSIEGYPGLIEEALVCVVEALGAVP